MQKGYSIFNKFKDIAGFGVVLIKSSKFLISVIIRGLSARSPPLSSLSYSRSFSSSFNSIIFDDKTSFLRLLYSVVISHHGFHKSNSSDNSERSDFPLTYFCSNSSFSAGVNLLQTVSKSAEAIIY